MTPLTTFAGDIGQAEVAAIVAIGQFGVVKAEQGEDGGVQVVDVHRVLHRLGAEFIGGAVNGAAFDAAARQPECRIPGSCGRGPGLSLPLRSLGGSAAEFAAPDHQRAVQQAALFQVGQKRAERLVNFQRALAGGFPRCPGDGPSRRPRPGRSGRRVRAAGGR